MKRSIHWFFSLLLFILVIGVVGACREKGAPKIDDVAPLSLTQREPSTQSPPSGVTEGGGALPALPMGADVIPAPPLEVEVASALSNEGGGSTGAGEMLVVDEGLKEMQDAPLAPMAAGGDPQPVEETQPVAATQPVIPVVETPVVPVVQPVTPEPSVVVETKSSLNHDKKSKKSASPAVEKGVKVSQTLQLKRFRPGDNRSKAAPLAKDGIHDPSSPGLALLQEPAQSLSVIPEGQWGEVDWMQAIVNGVIDPHASLNGKGSMELLDLDIILTNTKNMHHVRFPHISHTRWLACSNCHPDIFIPKKGANVMTMNDIFKGRFCGTCHGRVAFSVYICQRCHSVAHDKSPPKWW